MVQATKRSEKGCTVSRAALLLDVAEHKDLGSLLITKQLKRAQVTEPGVNEVRIFP